MQCNGIKWNDIISVQCRVEEHIIASLSAQYRHVYCLVEMAPSTPNGWNWRPSRPERTTKPMSTHNNCFRSFNIPNPQKRSQKKNSTIRSIPKKLLASFINHEEACNMLCGKGRVRTHDLGYQSGALWPLCYTPGRSIPKPLAAKPTISKAKPKQNFHQLQQQPQQWIQRMTEQQNWYRIIHWNPQSKICWKIMNLIAQNLSCQNTKRKMSCSVLILQQIKHKHSKLKFLRDKSSEATAEEE